jgi:preprotein translocase subunit SecD
VPRRGQAAAGDGPPSSMYVLCPTARAPLLVQQQVLLTGEVLTDAAVHPRSQFHEPYISLAFDATQAHCCERITAVHAGEPLGIVLGTHGRPCCHVTSY